MPTVSYPPYYPQQILDADGKPVSGGRILSFYAGTDVPLAMFAPDGVSLGSSVNIASDGSAVFCLKVGTSYKLVCVDANGATVWVRDRVKVSAGEGGGMVNPMEAPGDLIVGGPDGDPLRLAPGNEGDALKIVSGVPTWTTDQTGMANPMTTKGDLIVGATDGEPDRLGVGNDGDILASALFAGELSPTWEAGPKKYRNVYKNIPSPDIDDGYLGCLFYLDDTATLTLPATANIPSKSFIDFVFLADAETLTITPQGTTTLNGQGSAVTIGGKSASFYRLTFLGHGGSGDEWAVGGTDTATQPGDHKTAVDGADSSPDYLAAKLSAGTGISLTNTGSAVQIAATAQTGDHQLLVSATDAAAGYLGAKLTAGANITLTQQTDGDGVQTLEIAAAGGGGGGGSATLDMSMPIGAFKGTPTQSLSQNRTCVMPMITEHSGTPSHVVIVLGTTTSCTLRGYIFNSSGAMLYYGQQVFTANPNAGFGPENISVFKIPVSALNGAGALNAVDALYVGFCCTSGTVKMWSESTGGGTGSNLYGRFVSVALNSGDSITYSTMYGTGYIHGFGILYGAS